MVQKVIDFLREQNENVAVMEVFPDGHCLRVVVVGVVDFSEIGLVGESWQGPYWNSTTHLLVPKYHS